MRMSINRRMEVVGRWFEVVKVKRFGDKAGLNAKIKFITLHQNFSMKVKEPLFDYINPDSEYKILNVDCLAVLNKMQEGKFDLILTSPPYNVGKSYETKTSIEKYLETQEQIIAELIRTLSEKGNLCWQVGNYVDKGEVFPLDIFYYQIF